MSKKFQDMEGKCGKWGLTLTRVGGLQPPDYSKAKGTLTFFYHSQGQHPQPSFSCDYKVDYSFQNFVFSCKKSVYLIFKTFSRTMYPNLWIINNLLL